jgi:hypothetical protein
VTGRLRRRPVSSVAVSTTASLPGRAVPRDGAANARARLPVASVTPAAWIWSPRICTSTFGVKPVSVAVAGRRSR